MSMRSSLAARRPAFRPSSEARTVSAEAAKAYLAQAEREAGTLKGRADVPPRVIRRIGVVGAGTMGAGIALAFVEHNYPVTLVEASEAALAKGRERIEAQLARQVERGRITPLTRETRLGNLRFSLEMKDLAAADLVVEAVFEELTIKRTLLMRLEEVLRPEAIIATNTSYLDVDALGEVLHDSSRLVGMHFFSPANIMKLLEVVRAAKTRPEVLATAVALGKALGKVVVVAGVCDGFIGNRILARYRAECEAMLAEGALPQEIDAAFEGYGFPMGPFAMSDLAGLDIGWARRKRLGAPRNPADALCEQGRFGQKTGAGWYRYIEGQRALDPAIEAMLAGWNGGRRVILAPERIMGRVLAVMADEGGKILAEGIAARASDIDVVLVNGYAFPRDKGGPMFQAAARAQAGASA